MRVLFKQRVLLVILLFAGILFVLNLSSEYIRGAFSSLLSPLHSSLWQTGGLTSEFLSGEFVELEERNRALYQQVLSLKEVEKENERLREAVGTIQRKEFTLLFTEIIGKVIERDVLLINKGRAEGVRTRMPVITQSRAAVGSIGEVFEHTAEVLLLSLKDSSSDVKIQGREVIGVLKGQGRYEARLDLIPQEEELQEKDVVVTSALGGNFPDNLLVGELKNIEKSDLTAFQGGKIELFFQTKRANSLFVIQNYP